jgi:hypothetical protein
MINKPCSLILCATMLKPSTQETIQVSSVLCAKLLRGVLNKTNQFYFVYNNAESEYHQSKSQVGVVCEHSKLSSQFNVVLCTTMLEMSIIDKQTF